MCFLRGIQPFERTELLIIIIGWRKLRESKKSNCCQSGVLLNFLLPLIKPFNVSRSLYLKCAKERNMLAKSCVFAHVCHLRLCRWMANLEQLGAAPSIFISFHFNFPAKAGSENSFFITKKAVFYRALENCVGRSQF